MRGAMSSMTIPERISEFLAQRQERMYCDTCIQERLGLRWRQQVQLITATLAVTTTFEREVNKCCTCQEIKQVTRAIRGANRTQPPGVGADSLRRERRYERPLSAPHSQDASSAP